MGAQIGKKPRVTQGHPKAPPRVALVLQGGGALGAYQAGVFQAMHQHGLAPDWIVGTSIGAINGALIAGNPPKTCMARLKQFWESIARRDLFDMRWVPDMARQFNCWWAALQCTTGGVPGFFVPRQSNPFAIGMMVSPEEASFYDTSCLRDTLLQMVDFDYLNSPHGTRLMVSAMRVNCGQLDTFDNRKQRIEPEHIMASAALPPSFPPVRIDGVLYWDGGLYSNTPLENVLADEPHVDTLCFMVDLWSAKGPEPVTFDQVHTRQKDVLYASRSSRHIEAYLRGYKLKRMIRKLRDKLPEGALSDEERRELDDIGADTTMHIVRLAYAGRDWLMASKDVNFSKGSIDWRWREGYHDALRAMESASWRTNVPVGAGVLVHEFGPQREDALRA